MPHHSRLGTVRTALLLLVLSGCDLSLDSPADEDASDSAGGAATDPLEGSELDPDSDDFDYPGDEYAGRVAVTLHPQAAVEPDKNREVVFAVPFPRGWLEKADSVSLHDGSGEIPVHVEELTRWPDPEDGSGSIRAVRVTLEEAFSSRDPLTLELRWGGARKQELGG
ncbi:MAG: hypothetical protein ACOC48_01005, partial [Thiohalospira sp.]